MRLWGSPPAEQVAHDTEPRWSQPATSGFRRQDSHNLYSGSSQTPGFCFWLMGKNRKTHVNGKSIYEAIRTVLKAFQRVSKLPYIAIAIPVPVNHLGFKEYFRPIPSVVGMGDESPYLWITGVEFEGSDEATVAKILNKHHVAFNATGESHPWHLLPAVVIEL
ncbi:hypothetical protein DH86_00003287 [Scytalidium sp. 3C]|nr:hypothetical protein DH86_00003287 [Scytalidium sp. 3C]